MVPIYVPQIVDMRDKVFAVIDHLLKVMSSTSGIYYAETLSHMPLKDNNRVSLDL